MTSVPCCGLQSTTGSGCVHAGKTLAILSLYHSFPPGRLSCDRQKEREKERKRGTTLPPRRSSLLAFLNMSVPPTSHRLLLLGKEALNPLVFGLVTWPLRVSTALQLAGGSRHVEEKAVTCQSHVVALHARANSCYMALHVYMNGPHTSSSPLPPTGSSAWQKREGKPRPSRPRHAPPHTSVMGVRKL